MWLNPVANASPPRVLPPEVRPPTVEQVTALLDDLRDRDPELFAFVRLAAATGARRSQLLGLRWAELDADHSAIGFCRAFVDGQHGPVLRATKNHRSYRVSIDAGTLRLLAVHWSRAHSRARAAGVELSMSGFVFSDDPVGRLPWLPNRVTKSFIRARHDAGVGHFRLHDLRHFMATVMLANGVPVPTVSQRLGHAPASTTLNVYAHRIPGADRDAADLIGGLLDTPAGPHAGAVRAAGSSPSRRRRADADVGTGARPRAQPPHAMPDVVPPRRRVHLLEELSHPRVVG